MDLTGPLKAYLSANFAPRDASDAADDIAEINQVRSDVIKGGQTGDARRELLQKCAPRLDAHSLPQTPLCRIRSVACEHRGTAVFVSRRFVCSVKHRMREGQQ